MSYRVMYVVELQHECWLAPWHGDPGRTLVIDHAKLFDSEAKAKRALTLARKYRDLPNAFVDKVRVQVV